MKIKRLLKDLPFISIRGSREVEITGVSASSKLVSPGNLFIAKRGRCHDGNRYIPEAIAAGAAAVLTDIYDPTLKNVVQLIYRNAESVEAALAATYYQHPSEELYMIGITGTNGKTTTSFYVKHLLESLGIPTGIIGSIEYITGVQRYEAQRTTPDVCSNHKLLREMVHQGCQAAVMEVTSHALDQGRVAGIQFDIGIFTNLTPEHLDYHQTMDNYAKAKSQLFRTLPSVSQKKNANSNPLKPAAIYNLDSPWTTVIQEGCPARTLTYSLQNPATLQAMNVQFSPNGTYFTLHHDPLHTPFYTPMVGRFNLYNALATLAVGIAFGFPLDELRKALANFPPVPGRLEPVPNALDYKIYVDYAHKADALRNVLQYLKEVTSGRLLNVFGCGGDRDRAKRPLMGAVSEELADLTIVTTDNPRSEPAESICAEIVSGIQRQDKYLIELDRRKAIALAIELMRPGDALLIAGKGHETRQVFAHQTIDFDDRLVAAELCQQFANAGTK